MKCRQFHFRSKCGWTQTQGFAASPPNRQPGEYPCGPTAAIRPGNRNNGTTTCH
jgi:hypothetical protein